MTSGIYKRQLFTEKHRKNISLASKKRWKNKEYRKKINLARKGTQLKEKNPMWKGNKAGKVAFHIWLRKNKSKPKFCEECNKNKKLDLANMKNHKYTRNPKDYKWLCRGCHQKRDKKN